MKKPLVISILALITIWVSIGTHTTYSTLTKKVFDSISPPTALFDNNSTSLYIRLLDSIIDYSETPVLIFGVFVPILIIILVTIHFIRKRKVFGNLKTVTFILLSLIIISLLDFMFLFLIPEPIQWATLRIKASMDSKKAIDIISKKEIITDTYKIIEYIESGKPVKVYSDYGKSGVLLVALTENKEKLSFYESFYLPIYLSTRKNIKIGDQVNDSEMYLIGEHLVISEIKDMTNLKRIILSLAHNILVNSYGENLNLLNRKQLVFDLIPDEQYKDFFIKKTINDLQEDLDINKKSFETNNDIINNYQKDKQTENEKYKEFVTDAELKYENGCVKTVIYNDCVQFKETIEKNKNIIANNRISLDTEYRKAINFNIEIKKNMDIIQKRLDEIRSGRDSLQNNQSQYSVGVSFGNNTIYLRLFKDRPINSETMRIMVHELLHSYSFKSSRDIPIAIDEGLTDFLTLQAIGLSEIDTIRASSYPIEVQIILALLEKIDRKDLVRVYFSGSEKEFEKIFTENFPDINYKDFIKKIDQIFNVTFRVGGTNRNFDKSLLDHDEVKEVRKMLGLPERKFTTKIY